MESRLFTSMVTVDVYLNCESHTTRLRNIRRQIFLQLAIRTMGQILYLKPRSIYIQINWIKHHLLVMMCLQVSKYIYHLGKIHTSQQRNMRRQHWYFTANINMTKFYHPLKYSNHGLKLWHLLCQKQINHINIRMVSIW